MNRISATTITRWTIATLVFLVIGWVDTVYGHRWGLSLLVIALLVVYAFGGHGPRQGTTDAGAPGPDERLDRGEISNSGDAGAPPGA